MIKDFWKYVILFVVLVLVQVIVLNNIQISGFINPYIYILFIMLLPFNMPGYFLLPVAFLTGLTIDIFGNTPGIHSGATVLLAFVRPALVQLISTRELLEKGVTPDMNQLGVASFIKYTIIAVLLHHLVLFFAGAFSFGDILSTILRWIISSAFSILIILGSQFITFKK